MGEEGRKPHEEVEDKLKVNEWLTRTVAGEEPGEFPWEAWRRLYVPNNTTINWETVARNDPGQDILQFFKDNFNFQPERWQRRFLEATIAQEDAWVDIERVNGPTTEYINQDEVELKTGPTYYATTLWGAGTKQPGWFKPQTRSHLQVRVPAWLACACVVGGYVLWRYRLVNKAATSKQANSWRCHRRLHR